MASDFDKWFTAQFGPPTFKTPEEAQDASAELASRRLQLDALEREMRRHEMYEARRTATLYAWQAKPTGAKGLTKTRGKR